MEIKKTENGYRKDAGMKKEWILACIVVGIAVGHMTLQLIIALC